MEHDPDLVARPEETDAPRDHSGHVHTPSPQQTVSDLMTTLAIPLETLANLTYLAHVEADHPQAVRLYMDQALEQMAIVGKIVREVFKPMAEPTIP